MLWGFLESFLWYWPVLMAPNPLLAEFVIHWSVVMGETEMSPLFLHFWQIRWRLRQHHPCPDWPLPSHVWSGTPGMGGGVAVETGWAILGRKCQRILHIGRRYLIVITYAYSKASRLHMIQEWWSILRWVLNWPPLGLSFYGLPSWHLADLNQAQLSYF